ncbi:MAG: DUF3500 domain-containing protein [Planctomycetia bacterium]|nr:DUF3500 domain-containing protein [Planctomycetia bacterium]
MQSKFIVGAGLLILAVAGGGLGLVLADPGPDMVAAAQGFLESLSADQRATATLPFDDPARLDWHFIPKPERKGLQIKHMDERQRKAAHKLLASGLSHLGYDKATTIMSLEAILHELEKSRTGAPVRDPERYYFTVFGTPASSGRWGWSIEGHHLSLNFVVDGDRVTATTPTFFGANPAEVKSDLAVGPKKGTRALKPEEDLGFQLLASLSPEQRKKALVADKAPNDLRGAATPRPPRESLGGLSAADMNDGQRAALRALLKAYADNMPDAVAHKRLEAVDQAGIEKLAFAWAGADHPGVGHYYVVQGPTFVIEFVNTQPDSAGNPANHIHSVWRDMQGDFGQRP